MRNLIKKYFNILTFCKGLFCFAVINLFLIFIHLPTTKYLSSDLTLDTSTYCGKYTKVYSHEIHLYNNYAVFKCDYKSPELKINLLTREISEW